MTNRDTSCSIAVEDVFGPVVSATCLGGFDFTLLFEESILTTIPLGIAGAWSIWRLLHLRHEVAKVKSSWLLACKMVAFAVYTALLITLLALWAPRGAPKTRLTVACVALTVAFSFLLSVVSYFEHIRSVRPSTVLIVYLGTSLVLDLARVRTLFFIPEVNTIAKVSLASFVVKLFIFMLEITEKRHLLRDEWKKASPEETSSTLNRAMFIWLNGVFIKGFRTLLTVNALAPLDSEILSASKPTALMEEWELMDKESDHALFWLFARHFKWPILAGVLPRLAYAGFNFAQPYLVQRVLDFTDEPAGPNRKNTTYALIGAYAVTYIGLSLSYSVYQHKTYRLLTLYRGSLIAMISDKTLRIDSLALDPAEAITLMSADVDRITGSMHLVHEIYASIVELGIALWLLYNFLGVAMVAPIVWMIFCLLVGIPLARASGNAQVPWLEAIEDRLASTAKALGAMKAIRMTGLADIVSSQIADLRAAEIRASRRHRILNVFVFMSSFTSTAFASVWGFMAYILIAKRNGSGTLTQGVAFASLSVFELLDQPIRYAIDGMEDVQTVINSFRRVQEYLVSEEREDYRDTPQTASATSSSSCVDEKMNVLSSSSVRISDSEFAASIEGASARYAEDDNTIIQDLTFQITTGQTTIIYGPVGSGKSTLLKLLLGEIPFVSGSISTTFSEAAYCPQSPWCSWGTVRSNIVGMSNWDEKWYNTIVNACALSTDFEDLPLGDQTHAGTRGSRLSGGQQSRVSLARALYSRNATVILDDVLAGLDRTTEQHIIDAVFGPDGLLRKANLTAILTTNSVHHLRFADSILLLDGNGNIVKQSTSADVDGEDIQKLQGQPRATTTKPEDEITDELLEELGLLEDPSPDANRNAGDMTMYAYYAKNAGWWTMSLYIFACAIFVFGFTFPSVWVQWWTNANATHPNERIGYWVGIFAALGVLTLVGCGIADYVFNLNVLPKTSKRFHQLLLDTTMRAPTSFLTSTDAGTTLNRFSQDLELIDNDLPQSIDSVVFQFLSTIVSAVLVFMGSGYVAAAIPLCIVVLLLLQFYYLRTSRQLRLLDIEAKAPLFSQFLETIQGLTLIRAYGWTENYNERSHQALNISQRPYYLLFCIQRWLTLVLDLFNAGLAILVVAIALNVHSTAYLGVALFNIVTFSSTLQTLVTDWIQVETALGAISRIRTYVRTVEDENLPSEDGDVPEDWPTNGTITFEGISASYNSPLEPVLKNISVSINDGEKVAICGRTGSGKSSLISTLLRMLEVDSGTMTIDGIDISTLPRQEIRSRLNTLPQEPFFLEGSVRENLDPAESASDERMVEVLRNVGLWEQFESNDGLDGDMDEEMLSHGQRQLFCLARAVIKPGKILIMDEATSSVDSETDDLMQEIIRKEFRGRTVISIAHKLQTILDFDRVILLQKGQIIEIGSPRELLESEESAFRALYDSQK
ncbi:ABC multidrug transporter B [Cladobotryum mycophilum]|uniref:ABC multidrug transporter B n=1 Tax=Cladobotryum mycophilum TaxID=491253 RepID=A0ABR0SAY1_9HYPO